VPDLKAPIRLALLDCNVPKERSGIYTALPSETYQRKASELAANRRIDLSVFKPEAEGRMPALKEFDAMVLADSSKTPTREFMERSELGKMLPEFINNVVESGKLSLCICFGMEAVAASFGVYPESLLEEGTGKTFNLGYSTVKLTEAAKKDPLFMDYRDGTKAIFAHRYFVGELPSGAVKLAKTTVMQIAAFKIGNVYCVQWQPDLDLPELLNSAEQHRSSGIVHANGYESMLNPFGIVYKYKPEYDGQNSQALDLFFKRISE